MKFREFITLLYRNLCLIVVISVIGLLFMLLVYCIPSSTEQSSFGITYNTNKSLEWIDSQPSLFSSSINTTIDRSSDRIMLSIAGYPNTEGIVSQALMSYELEPGSKVTFNSEYWKDSAVPYQRYWHGYVVFLRPLLLFCDVIQIYYLLMIIQFGLLVLISIISYKRRMAYVIPSLLLTFVFWNPSATTVCIFYNSCISLSMIGVLLYLKFRQRWDFRQITLMFSILGALTSFFDLSTYPLIVYGIPLMVVVLDNKFDFKNKVKLILVCTILWGMSYVLIWVLKWILVWLICGISIYDTAIEAVLFRTSSNDLDLYTGTKISDNRVIALFQVIKAQLKAGYNPLFVVVLVVICLFLIIVILLNSRSILTFNARTQKSMFLRDLCLGTIVLVPLLVWYGVVVNHSMIHSWMTFRNLGIPMFGFFSIVFKYTSLIFYEKNHKLHM